MPIKSINQRQSFPYQEPRICTFKEMKLALALLHARLQILAHNLETLGQTPLASKEIEHMIYLNQETQLLCQKIEKADLDDLTGIQFTLLSRTHKNIIQTLIQACGAKQNRAIDILLGSDHEIAKKCGKQISDILTQTPQSLEQNRKIIQIANLWYQSNHALDE